MKHIIIGLLIGSCVFSQTLTSFEILSQSPETENLGYGDYYLDTDGEGLLMNHFLKSGDMVFDVGGNEGDWSYYALKAQPNIQIIAFEPLPSAFTRFKERLQECSNVQPFNYALSDQKGTAEFHYYDWFDALSGFYYRDVLRERGHPDPQVISVQQETLDEFCVSHAISKIDFIKIDTEGAEWKVLNGARNLLKNHQVKAIQFEYGGCYVDAKTTLKQVVELLKDNKYVIFRIIPTGLLHISKWDPNLENFNLSNYFAIYKEDCPPEYDLVQFN